MRVPLPPQGSIARWRTCGRRVSFYTSLMRDEDLRSRIVAVACYGSMATWGEEGSLGKAFAMTSEGLARRYRVLLGLLGGWGFGEEVGYLRGHPG